MSIITARLVFRFIPPSPLARGHDLTKGRATNPRVTGTAQRGVALASLARDGQAAGIEHNGDYAARRTAADSARGFIARIARNPHYVFCPHASAVTRGNEGIRGCASASAFK
jgi:hypothetical protein